MDAELVKAALCRALPADGSIPEWVELLPAGVDVVGRDGRRFKNPNPKAIVEAFNANGADLPIDWEHSTELLAPDGQPAPAAAWIRELAARDGGSIWARVDWTPKGADSIKTREYRYLSPVFWKDEDNNILEIKSAALTNQPNLRIAALNNSNQHGEGSNEPEPQTENAMDPKLLKALGLSDKATADEVLAAIEALKVEKEKALNAAQNPTLDRFVPRADYEAALNRASTAERTLAAEKQTKVDGEIETEIKAALEAGKITPSTVEYHRSQCRTDGGLGRFREYVKAAPVIGDPSSLNSRRPPASEGGQQTPIQLAVMHQLGTTPELLAKYRAS